MNAILKEVARKDYDVGLVFDMPQAVGKVFIKGNSNKTEDVPLSNPDYVFNPFALTDYMRFYHSNETAYQIIGHTGTGKSSFVEEFNARLNLPLYVYNAHPRTTQSDLIGELLPDKNGNLQFVFGPLALAAINGCACLIDEYNLIDPGEASGLNGLIEGRSQYIREIGTWIHPAQGFKLITTINPKTAGYIGRNDQDGANDDRFSYALFDYMPAENEIKLLNKLFAAYGVSIQVSQALSEQFRQVADMVRQQYMGSSDMAGALDVTISTRSLLRWVSIYMDSKNVSQSKDKYSPVHYALERAKTFKASNESRIAIHDLVTQIFGDEYRTPLTLA